MKRQDLKNGISLHCEYQLESCVYHPVWRGGRWVTVHFKVGVDGHLTYYIHDGNFFLANGLETSSAPLDSLLIIIHVQAPWAILSFTAAFPKPWFGSLTTCHWIKELRKKEWKTTLTGQQIFPIQNFSFYWFSDLIFYLSWFQLACTSDAPLAAVRGAQSR